MKCFKLVLLTVLWAVICFVLSGNPRANAEQKEDKAVCFRWAFGALVRAQKGPEFVAIKQDTTLRTGDQFKMFVELQRNCYVYVVYHSAQGEVYLLFPYNLQQFDTNYQTFKQYYIPQDDGWFELDENIGHETFYLLASSQRLIELEGLFTRYTTTELVKREDLARQILAQIRDIKRRHRKFKTFAERPLQILGNIRGVDDTRKALSIDISSIAVEISAKSFYSRTFTIDHQ